MTARMTARTGARTAARAAAATPRAGGPFQLAASRVALAGLLAIVLGIWQVAVPGRVSAANERSITYYSAATYTVQPAQRQVHVAVRVTATVHAKDTVATRSWFEGLSMAVPSTTDGFKATAGQTSLPVSITSKNQSDTQIAVGFNKRVYADQSFTFLLEFNLVDRGTAPDRDLRLSQTLVSFPVWAYGTAATPGSSVVVAFPSGYSVNQEVGNLTNDTNQTGATTYRSGPLGDVTQFYAWFSAHTTPSYDQMTTKIAGLQVTLRYWADDPNWAPAIAGLLAKAYPPMRDLIGIGDPSTKAITIVESAIRDGAGYSGVFEPDTGTISVSYSADPFVLLHETAHLWFNANLVSTRWEAEGFATYYAAETAQKLKIPILGPSLTADGLAASFALDGWKVTENPDPKAEQYGYAAAAAAARQIAGIAGDDGLATVWAADKAGYAAYQTKGAGTWTPRSGPPPDSRGLLDLLEEKTGKSYDSVWRQWIFDTAGDALLDRRAAARASYSALLDEAAGWSLPDEFRTSLEAWDFDAFTLQVAEARAVFTNRTTIAGAVTREKTSAPEALRTAFEKTGVVAALRESNAELRALDALAGARIAGEGASGTAGAVGLFGANPEKTLQEARDAFAAGRLDDAMRLADEARAIWEGATDAGRNRLLLAGAAALAVVLVLLLGLYVRHRRRAARRAVAATAAIGSPATSPATAMPAPDAAPAVATADPAPASAAGAVPASRSLELDEMRPEGATASSGNGLHEPGAGSGAAEEERPGADLAPGDLAAPLAEHAGKREPDAAIPR